jgi:hypothetical protein
VSVNYREGGRFFKTAGSIGGNGSDNTADHGKQVFVLINYNAGTGAYTYRVRNDALTESLSVGDDKSAVLNDTLWDGGNPDDPDKWINPGP